MSVENVLEFMKSVASDTVLQQRLAEGLVGRTGREADQVVVELARRHGLHFTVEESRQARDAVKRRLVREGQLQGELSDDDLESVTGGVLTASLADSRATLPIPIPMPAQLFLSCFGSW